MAEKPLNALLKQKTLREEIARLVKDVRFSKDISQQALCDKTGISRQRLSEVENGRSERLDLDIVVQFLNACGETLDISSSYENPLQIIDQTEREDAILKLFSKGEIEEAERQLNQIRRWGYPSSYITAQCKRNMAIAISYHFRGMRSRSQLRMNDLLMGLSFIGCHDDAEHFIEMYHRIITQGEASLLSTNEEVRS